MFEKVRGLAPMGEGELHVPPYVADADISTIALGTYEDFLGPGFPDVPLPGSLRTTLAHNLVKALKNNYGGDTVMGIEPGGIRGQAAAGCSPRSTSGPRRSRAPGTARTRPARGR